MKTTKKILFILLAVLLLTTTMALCAVPTSALPVTGSCGTNLTYTFNTSTGAVTISGTGSSISSEAFKNHPEINSVSICDSVKTIGSEAFFRCTNLESVSFPSGLERINYQAFYACNKLKSANIPATVTTIGEGAFEGCWALTVFSIPDGVAAIAKEAFAHCDHLKTVVIPASVTSIGNLAFASCSLTDVYFKGTESQWNNITIGSDNDSLNNATKHFNTSSDTRLVQINVSASPTSAGTVSGGGAYLTGESVTITATPNAGYKFTGWYYRNNKVSSNATYTFTAATDGNLKAEFDPLPSYTVSASASPSAGGTVTGGGSYFAGNTATVTATPKSGWHFTGWFEGNNKVSSNASYTFTVAGEVTLTAKFEKDSYTVTLTANPSEGGTVYGSGTYNSGAVATLIATPASGWHFVGWYQYGTQVSAQQSYFRAVVSDLAYVAKFEKDSYTITVSADPAEGGTVSGGGTYETGTYAALTATPNSGYKFDGWYQGSTLKSTNANYTFTVTGNITLTAKFSQATTYTVTVNKDPANGGTVTGGGTYAEGASTTLTATPNPGWEFVGFYDANGARLGNLSSSFTVTQNMTFTAKFVHVDAIPAIKLSTDSLNDGDWYLDRDALTASVAAANGMSVEDFKALLGDPFANAYAKYDPQSGIIVLEDPDDDTTLTVILPSDDGYAMCKAGIKQYHAPSGGDNSGNQNQPDNGGQPQGKVCKYCGEVHTGFLGFFIGLFHSILALFGLRK